MADYLELGELMCYDALTREESCGAHFREEYQTPDGEACGTTKILLSLRLGSGLAPARSRSCTRNL